MRRLRSSAGLTAGLAIFVFSLGMTGAEAACTPATGSNVSVTCSGTTTNQGPGSNTGYGDSTQDGLTLTVQSGASVIGTSTGIDVNNNNTINNFGTITTQGSGGVGDVWGINGNGPLTVNNSGTIGKVDLSTFVSDLAGINTFSSGLVVNNNQGGLIQGETAIQGAVSATIVNSGTINAIVGGGGQGINVAGGSVNVTNNASGLITADGFAINADTVAVTNSGTISAPGFGGSAINATTSITVTNNASGIITSDGSAISASTIAVTNFGMISGTDLGSSGISGGTVSVINSGSILGGLGAAAISMSGGSVANNAGGVIAADEGIAASAPTSVFNAGTITGNTGVAIAFSGSGNMLTIAPTSVINGTVLGGGTDTFQLGGAGGTGTLDLGSIGSGQQYQGFSTFNVVGATWTVSGTYGQTDPWTVEAGTLNVTGDLSAAASLTVTGGTLAGTGTVGDTQINTGGVFAPGAAGTPGTSLTVAVNLSFAPGATYQVEVDPATASFANVTGTAALAGTVNAVFAPGSYIAKQYMILQSTGLGGTTFSGLINTNLPADIIDNLSYSADDVYLNLTAALPTGGLGQNQQTIANLLNNYFNSGGTLPPGFAGLFNLTGANLANALTQIDGENATGAEKSAFDLMNGFLDLMLDPYVYGRSGLGSGDQPLGFAPDQADTLPPEIALA